jgi:hypothetical protein
METPEHASDPVVTDRDGDIGFIDTGGLAAGQNWFYSRQDGGPWSTLAIYRNRLVITGLFLGTPYDFARSEVDKIAVEGWFSSCIRIYHLRRDYPPYIAFWPFSLDSVIEGFRRVGYSVECK